MPVMYVCMPCVCVCNRGERKGRCVYRLRESGKVGVRVGITVRGRRGNTVRVGNPGGQMASSPGAFGFRIYPAGSL